MTNTNKKNAFTKREYFTALLAEVKASGYATEEMTNEMFVNFIEHELDLLSRKNVTASGEKKLTDTQKANIELGEQVVSFLTDSGEQFTVTNLIKAMGLDIANQRMTHVLSRLVNESKVEKVIIKRVSYYKIAS